MKDLHLGGNDHLLGKFQVYRMLPQQKILYFFSYNGIPFINSDPTLKSMKIDDNIIKDICKTLMGKGDVDDPNEMPSGIKLRYEDLNFKKPFKLQSMNLMETEPLIGMIINAQARGGTESALSSYVSTSGVQANTEAEDDESHELTDVY